ncbi:MAG TPA: multiheme c-type cytochrome [Gemmata sp.]|jgi:predicted CXXCH cytochrome family protein|nr:multiheme c-type cytochrome [Gemmata sp.]
MHKQPRNARGTFRILAAIAAACVAFLIWAKWPATHTAGITPSPPTEAFPPPPFTASRFLNVQPEVAYVGSAACAECHEGNQKSYRLTHHSRALSDIDASKEPPDGSFEHKASGRSYRVYRQGNEFRHEEVLRSEQGKEIARIDFPIRYLVGSGHFTRSYLIEVDGFLHESPITWYSSKNKWDMSPGYDAPRHQGFERIVPIECLACHAGRVEQVAGTEHRFQFHEKAIGCENCHGPGALHRDLQLAKKVPRDEEDLSIVHPGKLSRSLKEAICASCHQSGSATVYLRGRDVGQIRPGMPLTDYRIHYRFDSGTEKMTVVGHIDQLRQSGCYQKSEDLTCLTCHDPHQKSIPSNLTAYYREKCLNCHDTHPCTLNLADRLKKDPSDNCAACHMPRGDTDIPHIAFTHHRIGKHKREPQSVAKRIPDLVPADDISHLAALEQRRNLGLAYAEIYLNPLYGEYAAVFRERAREHLEAAYAAGMREGETAANLAEIYWTNSDLERAASFALQSIQAKDTSPRSRANALSILASCERINLNLPSSTAHLEEATRMRRVTNDWGMLGLNYLDLDQPGKSLAAFQRALSIRPYDHTTQQLLADLNGRLGDTTRSREHAEKAQWLLQHPSK